MLNETKEHFREQGYWREEGKLNRETLAKAIGKELSRDPAAEEDDVEEKSRTVFELRTVVVGSSEHAIVNLELDNVIGQLLPLRGLVQRYLADGLVLCSTSVMRELTNGDTPVSIKRTARFVTTNPDLIERYHWTGLLGRMVSAAHGANEAIGLSIERQPELAARRQAAIRAAHVQAQLELPETTSETTEETTS